MGVQTVQNVIDFFENKLNNLMVVKNWFKESLPGCVKKLCLCF